jgi:hypothetical protein
VDDYRVISVMSYGATGDGKTPDHDAIKSAIEAAAANGALVWFPPGQYRVGQTIDVPAGTHIKGSGRGVTPFGGGVNLAPTATVLLAEPGIVCFNVTGYSVTIQDLAIYFGGPSPTSPLPNVQRRISSQFRRLSETAGIKLGNHCKGKPEVDHAKIATVDAPHGPGMVCDGRYISYVVLDRLEVIASGGSFGRGAGILSFSSCGCVMRNCHIEGFESGVYLREPYCCPPNSWEIDGCWINICKKGVVFSGETWIHDSVIEGNVVGVTDELYYGPGVAGDRGNAQLHSCRNHYENNVFSDDLPTAQILIRYNGGPHSSVSDNFGSPPDLPASNIIMDPSTRRDWKDFVGDIAKRATLGDACITVIGGNLNTGITVDNGVIKLIGCDGPGANPQNTRFASQKSTGVVWHIHGRDSSAAQAVRNLKFPDDIRPCDEFITGSTVCWFDHSHYVALLGWHHEMVKVGRDGHSRYSGRWMVGTAWIEQEAYPDHNLATEIKVSSLHTDEGVAENCPVTSGNRPCPPGYIESKCPRCPVWTVKVKDAAVGDAVEVGLAQVLPPGAFLVGAVTEPDTVKVMLFNRSGQTLVFAGDTTLQATVWKYGYAPDYVSEPQFHIPRGMKEWKGSFPMK